MKFNSGCDGWKHFLELCSSMNTTEQLKQLFDLFLTIEEKENLASRYQIVKALIDGKFKQREISRLWQVSIAQITRGSNALKIVNPEFKSVLAKLLD